MHCRVVDQGARGGQARAVREAALAARRREVEAAFDAADRVGPAAERGVHVPPQPADEAREGARRRRRDRRAAARPLHVQLLALRRGQHPAAHGRRGRRADGRRLLHRQRLAALRRRARARVRRGVVRADRAPTGSSAACSGSPATSSRSSTAAPRCRSATSSRRSAARARSSSTTRGTARCPVIELRRDGSVERIELEPADSYRLELENVSDAIRGEGELLLGREDAVGQARALEALLRVGDDRHVRRVVTDAEARERAAAMLADAGIVLTPAEREQIEVADFGLGRLDGDRAAARRLREHGAGVREGARALPGADLPRASPSPGRRQPGQGGDVPLPHRQRPPAHRGPRGARAAPGRPGDDPARHAPLVPGGRRRARSSPSSRRRAATSSTSSPTRGSFARPPARTCPGRPRPVPGTGRGSAGRCLIGTDTAEGPLGIPNPLGGPCPLGPRPVPGTGRGCKGR